MRLCGVNAAKGNVDEDRLAHTQIVKMTSGGLPLRVWFLQGWALPLSSLVSLHRFSGRVALDRFGFG